MKVGDLVKFSAPPVYKAAESRYAPSGVVTWVGTEKEPKGTPRACYSVLWADGRTTNEWFSYLEVLN